MIRKLTNCCVSQNCVISIYQSYFIPGTFLSNLIHRRSQRSFPAFKLLRILSFKERLFLFLSLSVVNPRGNPLSKGKVALFKNVEMIKQIRRKLNSTPLVSSHASHLENLSLSEFIRNREEFSFEKFLPIYPDDTI